MTLDEDLVKALQQDYKTAAISDQDRVMLDYVARLTKDATDITRQDHERLRAVGFDDQGILQITLIASWFNYINRVADALGVGREKDPDRLIVRIPASVSSKADLLAILAAELSFPDYFGENWDALEEMLRDLSWLEPKRIVLAHASIPSQIGEDNLRIYRDILLKSVNHWKSLGQRELIVVFPD